MRARYAYMYVLIASMPPSSGHCVDICVMLSTHLFIYEHPGLCGTWIPMRGTTRQKTDVHGHVMTTASPSQIRKHATTTTHNARKPRHQTLSTVRGRRQFNIFFSEELHLGKRDPVNLVLMHALQPPQNLARHCTTSR